MYNRYFHSRVGVGMKLRVRSSPTTDYSTGAELKEIDRNRCASPLLLIISKDTSYKQQLHHASKKMSTITKTSNKEFQKWNTQNFRQRDEMRHVARRLHRIKRRILMEVENEGGNSQNNWASNECRSPLSCFVEIQETRD